MTFVLHGYDSPTGEYPSPVVPVGERDGMLCVGWRGADGVELEEVQREVQFVHYPMHDFDVVRDALFAFELGDVVAYPIEDEPLFFDAVLRDPRMKEADPFFRLALAIETGHEDVITSELVRARRRMQKNAPHYADRWYEETLARFGEEWTARGDQLRTLDDADLPCPPRAVLAGVALAERAFTREVTRLRDVLAHSSGNGKVEQLDGLRSAVSADVIISMAGRRVRPLAEQMRIPGAAIQSLFEARSAASGSDLALLHDPWGDEIRLEIKDVPELPTDDSWLSRVTSGLAGLEEYITRAVRDQIRIPRLRRGIERATSIGEAHRTVLHEGELRLKRETVEEHARMNALRNTFEEWFQSTRHFADRCTSVVAREVERWQPRFPRGDLSDLVRDLDLRCRRQLDDEVRSYLSFTQKLWARSVAGDAIKWPTAYETMAGLTAWTDGFFRDLRAARSVAARRDRKDLEESIRRHVLDGYLRNIEGWIRTMVERSHHELDEHKNQIIRHLTVVQHRGSKQHALLTETDGALRGLERLRVSFTSPSLYNPAAP